MSEISKDIENMIKLFENMKLKLKENENLKEEVNKLKEENEKLQEENKKLQEESEKFKDIFNLILKIIREGNSKLFSGLKNIDYDAYEEQFEEFAFCYNLILSNINTQVLKHQKKRPLEIYDERKLFSQDFL